ncbi:hypothetical protein AALP_AAs54083U000200 [Arabis alpina]|uniref:Fucosyltransferase n=1 Tax=Arabis alpina TaxID=50452 RepID=A0A087G1Y3_ARAAL|nr:hypothetical protein AALP_AAs54083U000200 [Arabis alpina]
MDTLQTEQFLMMHLVAVPCRWSRVAILLQLMAVKPPQRLLPLSLKVQLLNVAHQAIENGFSTPPRTSSQNESPFASYLVRCYLTATNLMLLPLAQDSETSRDKLLRSYEMLHERCGPGTYAYTRATEKLGHDDEVLLGEIVVVHQPSEEGYQQSDNQKALAEMYLLSMSDKVVISAWSTFG